jgi:hypothetical protein
MGGRRTVAVVDPVHDQPGVGTSKCGIIGSLGGSVYSWMSRSFWTTRGRWRFDEDPEPRNEHTDTEQAIELSGLP